MRLTTANKFVFFFAVLGLSLSAYLSWYALWGPGCQQAALSCSGGGKAVLILGLPTCAYGFFLYLAVIVLAFFVSRGRLSLLRATLALAVVGTGFTAGLSVYELFPQDTAVTSLPACVYGFFLYATILVFSAIGVKKLNAAI